MAKRQAYLLALSILVCCQVQNTSGHARLWEPPSRSSMHRFGLDNKPNYNDNELNCGGMQNQWTTNGGKCGVCGDAWQDPEPRPNERGGYYGKADKVRSYKQGGVIDIVIDVTANHKGWFEMRVCPTNDPSKRETFGCLDRHLLPVQGTGHTRYFLTASQSSIKVEYRVRLPADLTCSWCVLQWKWRAGNSWGVFDNGTACIGCGPQEEFYGCADVEILPSSGGQEPPLPTRPPVQNTPPPAWTPQPKSSTTRRWTPQPKSSTTRRWIPTPTLPAGTPEGTYRCCAVGLWSVVPDMHEWCDLNCKLKYCPATHCTCENC